MSASATTPGETRRAPSMSIPTVLPCASVAPRFKAETGERRAVVVGDVTKVPAPSPVPLRRRASVVATRSRRRSLRSRRAGTIALVRGRQRMQRPSRLIGHVVHDDDQGEQQVVRAAQQTRGTELVSQRAGALIQPDWSNSSQPEARLVLGEKLDVVPRTPVPRGISPASATATPALSLCHRCASTAECRTLP